MFDVGFTELLLIGIVALVVIGPERLPAVARTAGQWIAKLQRFVKGVKTDLASELDSGDLKKLIGDQREQIDELRSLVSSASKDFHNTTSDVVKSAKKRIDEMETSFKDDESSATGETQAQPVTDSAALETSHSSKDANTDKTGESGTTPAGKAESQTVVDTIPDDVSTASDASTQNDHSPTTKPPAGSSDMDRTGS